MLYLGRRVPKSEIATRVANIDEKYLTEVCKKWFCERKPAVTQWVPADSLKELKQSVKPEDIVKVVEKKS